MKHSLPALAETKGIFVLLSRSRCVTAFVTSSFRHYHTPRHREKLLQYFHPLERKKSNSVTSHSPAINCLNCTPLLFPRNTFLCVCAYCRLYSFKCHPLPVPSPLLFASLQSCDRHNFFQRLSFNQQREGRTNGSILHRTGDFRHIQ